LIPEQLRKTLQEEFSEKMKEDVKLVVFTQEIECPSCAQTRQLAEEVSSLAPKIKLEVFDLVNDIEKAKEYKIDRVPAITLSRDRTHGVRFFGMPVGYEFRPFTEDIIGLSRGVTRLSELTRSRLRNIDRPVHIQVFVTPTCPYCPSMVSLAHQLAMESEYITSDMVEIAEFPHLANRYAVMGVPKTVINETVEFVGMLPEDHFLEHVLQALKPSGAVYL